MSHQHCVPPCEIHRLPEACRCYQRLPNPLCHSWGCGRVSERIKVWQTNPLYKGLSFRTSPNFLFFSPLKTQLIVLLFPRIHVLHPNKCVFTLVTKSIRSPSPPNFHHPCPQPTSNKGGHLDALDVCFVYHLLPTCELTWHIINSYKNESSSHPLWLQIGSEFDWPWPPLFLNRKRL